MPQTKQARSGFTGTDLQTPTQVKLVEQHEVVVTEVFENDFSVTILNTRVQYKTDALSLNRGLKKIKQTNTKSHDKTWNSDAGLISRWSFYQTILGQI